MTRTGNRWSDYSGESEYRIDGSANAVDNYPVMVEALAPAQEHQEQGTGGGGIPGFTLEALLLRALAATLILTGPRCKLR